MAMSERACTNALPSSASKPLDSEYRLGLCCCCQALHVLRNRLESSCGLESAESSWRLRTVCACFGEQSVQPKIRESLSGARRPLSLFRSWQPEVEREREREAKRASEKIKEALHWPFCCAIFLTLALLLPSRLQFFI